MTAWWGICTPCGGSRERWWVVGSFLKNSSIELQFTDHITHPFTVHSAGGVVAGLAVQASPQSNLGPVHLPPKETPHPLAVVPVPPPLPTHPTGNQESILSLCGFD